MGELLVNFVYDVFKLVYNILVGIEIWVFLLKGVLVHSGDLDLIDDACQ